MDWLQIIMALVTAAIGAIVPWWLQRITTKMDAREAERIKHEQDIMRRLENLELALMEMQTAESERLAREQERIAQEETRMHEFARFREGMQAVLRDRISQSRRYFVEKGYIPQYEYENFQAMYEAYHALGGNGMATKAYNDISALPFEPPQE